MSNIYGLICWDSQKIENAFTFSLAGFLCRGSGSGYQSWSCTISNFMQQWNCQCASERSYRPGQENSHSKGGFQRKIFPIMHIIFCLTINRRLSDSFACRLKELRLSKTLTGFSVPMVKENVFHVIWWGRGQQKHFFFLCQAKCSPQIGFS